MADKINRLPSWLIEDLEGIDERLDITGRFSDKQKIIDLHSKRILDMQIEIDYLSGRVSSNSNQYIERFINENFTKQEGVLKPATLMDDNDLNNNWKYLPNESLNYQYGLLKPKLMEYVLEFRDKFDITNIGLSDKNAMSCYDSQKDCIWLLTDDGSGNGCITKLSSLMKDGQVYVHANYYIPNSASTWVGIDSDGQFLYLLEYGQGGGLGGHISQLRINDDDTLGESENTYSNGSVMGVDVTDFHNNVCNDNTNLVNGGSEYANDVVIWDNDHIMILNCDGTTNIELTAIGKSSSGFEPATETDKTGLEIFVGGSDSNYRSICKSGNNIYIRMNDATDNVRLIYKFNITTDIDSSDVFHKSSGRFQAENTDDSDGSLEGISINKDGDFLEIRATSNGKYIAKRALVDAKVAENQIVGEILTTDGGTDDNRSVCVDGNYIWYSANNSNDNAVRIYRREISTGIETYITINSGDWDYVYGMCVADVSGTDYFFLIGYDGAAHVSRAIDRSTFEGALGGTLDIGTSGNSFTSYPDEEQHGITSDGTYLYIINDTTDSIDRWTLASTPAISEDDYIVLPAAGNNWIGIEYNNGKFYISEFITGAQNNIYVIDDSPKIIGTPNWYLVHIHRDPTRYTTNGLMYLSIKNNDLYILESNSMRIYVMKTVDDPSAMQLQTFINTNNILLSDEFSCTTKIKKRYFDPEDYTENMRMDPNDNNIPQYSYAYHEGTVDLSSGFDWSSTPQDFNIDDGGGIDNVTLTANCADLATVISHVNSRLTAAGSNAEAYDAGSNHVGIRLTVSGTMSLSAGGTDALPTIGWTSGNYIEYDEVTMPSRVNVPNFYFQVWGYSDNGITIAGLDEFLSDISASGMPRRDVRKINVRHYEAGTDNLIMSGQKTYDVKIIDDMIFLCGTGSIQWNPLSMIDLKTGEAWNFSDTTIYKYNGRLVNRNEGEGWAGVATSTINVGETGLFKMSGKTFKKEDDTSYNKQNPTTYLAAGTNSQGTDLLVIDWINGKRIPTRIWNNIFNNTTAGIRGILLPDSGELIAGNYAANGQIYKYNRPVWEIQSDNEADHKLVFTADNYVSDIAPNSYCFKTPTGEWRHIITVGISNAAPGTSQYYGVVLVDIEKEEEEIIWRALNGSTAYYFFNVDAFEERIFAIHSRLSLTDGGLIAKKLKFDDGEGSGEWFNYWTLEYWAGSYYFDRPKFTLFQSGDSGECRAMRFSPNHNILMVGSTNTGIQMLHYYNNDNSRHKSIDLDVNAPNQFVYSKMAILPGSFEE